jgi:hypothetical protein
MYKVSVQAQGFQKAVADNVGLVVGQQARVNLTLKPGAITESVEVQASAVALDTDSSAVSQLVSQKQVEELPLNGRNFLNLLFISAGAVQTVGEQGQMRQGEGNAISINGGRPESNNYTLDGLVNTDQALSTPALILSQDAIQEFKIASETYSAEYGYSANQVNIVSKSGTNNLHGTVFEFARNDAFDASTPTPFQTAKKLGLRQNQFGFVVGGPVYIPKLYDGRNKTFFLVNYEGWRIRNQYAVNGIVPTTAELNGDFSATGLPPFDLTPGSPCQMALTATPNPTPCMPGDPQTGSQFAGPIPSSRFSRLAQVALANNLFPAPTPGCVANPQSCQGGNYQTFPFFPNNTNQQTYKIDEDMGRRGRVFFRYTKANITFDNPQNLSPTFSVNQFTEDTTSWTISHTISLGSRIVNNFRFGYLHATAIQGAPATSSSAISALNVAGIFSNLPTYARGFPTISLAFPLGSFGSPGNNPTTSDIPTWEFADSVTMNRGRHTIGFGFDHRRFVQKRNLSTNFLGGYSYTDNNVLNNSNVVNNIPTCTTPSGFCGTGNSVADFLLGYYNGAGTFQPGPFSNPKIAGNLNQYHFLYFAPYVQDDWKVTNRLTLNLGLRWDWRNVPYEQNNKMFWIDDQNLPGEPGFTGGGLCFANPALQNDGVAPAGNGFYRYCGRRNPADSSKKEFAPRFGFAWRPFAGEKTVIRGGYGIYWDSFESREIDDSGDLYPYVERTQLSPNSQSATVAPKLTDQLFPSLTAIVPVTAPNSQFVAVIISDHPRNPYVQQYTLSVQHELARNTTLEVNYVGNRGLHLLDRIDLNTPVQLVGAQLTTCQTLFAGLPATNSTYIADQCPFFARQPLPNFAIPGPLNSSWTGYSNYNAGNIRLEHRAADLALLTVYTWAKSMDDKSAAAGIGSAGGGFAGHMNDRIPSLDYGPSDFSVKHRFVNSVIYNLPVGRGKRFLGSMNRAEDALIGGWELGAITTFQSGFPFTVFAPDPGAYLSFSMRANQVGDPNISNKTINEWFNTAAFAQPAFGVYGSARRNTLTQPGINNWDINLIKTFQFTERVGFQFRVETFNTFNHTQYGVDPIAAAAGGPGQSAVDSSIGDIQFGKVTQARPGRIVQFGGKIIF